MRTWREKFQAMAMAVVFAEKGEWETAKSFLKEPDPVGTKKKSEEKRRPDHRPRKRVYRV
jgi:hypothetical protein